jgi:hypothetical protein
VEALLDAQRRRQWKRMPTPKLPVAVSAGTSWKTTGVKTNESRTRFAPTATRAVSSRSSVRSTVATAAPPTTANRRPLSAAGLRVCEPRADSRPISTEPQGRATTGPQRNRNGQASRLAASSVNAAVPRSSSIPARQAWLAPSRIAGDHSVGRSIANMAYRAMPGMSFGAGPSNAWAATCTARVLRPSTVLRPPTSGARARCEGMGRSVAADFASVAGAATGTLPLLGSTDGVSFARVPPPLATLGSSVTAMMSATASAASLQLAASTRRTEGFASAPASDTVAATKPADVPAKSARIVMAWLSSEKRARGERERTRAINSARLVQPGAAFTSRRAAAATPGSAALTTLAAPTIVSENDSDAIQVFFVTANGNIAR